MLKWLYVLAAILWASGSASAVQAQQRKVAVPDFDGQGASTARASVLEVLSTRGELEVVGYGDIKVAAKRIGADPMSSDGRVKLSAEMGIDVWFVGNVHADGGTISVIDKQGRLIGKSVYEGRSTAVVNQAIREKMWGQLGHLISDKAWMERELAWERGRAQHKQKARMAEMTRQRKLVQERQRALAMQQQRQQQQQQQQRQQQPQWRAGQPQPQVQPQPQPQYGPQPSGKAPPWRGSGDQTGSPFQPSQPPPWQSDQQPK